MSRPVQGEARLRPVPLLLGLIGFGLLALLLGLSFGSEEIDVARAVGEWIGTPRSEWSTDTHVLAVRLPRLLLGWLAGGALAVCGAVMQTLLRNGLATPFTLGVSAAGTFGAFLAVAFPAIGFLGTLGMQRVGALVFALVEVFLVLAVARRTVRADGLILAGVTFNFVFGAGTMMIRYLADPYELQRMERWMLGALDAPSFDTPLSLLPWLGVGLVILAWRLRALDFLSFDPELAAARGVPVAAAQRDALIATGILTAAVVAHSGPIAFVGLLVPHALRPFTGMRHAVLLPACWLAGGGFLVLADLLARSLEVAGRNSELPVGIVTALLGGPFFLLLLLRRPQG